MNRVITAVVVMILCAVSTMTSQQVEPLATPLPSTSMTITAGRGELLQFPDETTRVSVSDPTIADAIVVSAHDVVVNGKAPGNTTIMIWHGNNVSPYAVTVEPDLSEIQKQLRATLPMEHIDLSSSKDAIVLSGVVTNAEVAKQVAAIAAVHAKSVVNLLQSPPAERYGESKPQLAKPHGLLRRQAGWRMCAIATATRWYDSISRSSCLRPAAVTL